MAVSGRVQPRCGISAAIEGEFKMFARRFTIVCLMTTLFGLSFALLVADASRSARSWEIGAVVTCKMNDGPVCAPTRWP